MAVNHGLQNIEDADTKIIPRQVKVTKILCKAYAFTEGDQPILIKLSKLIIRKVQS
jgi:hypothetical protein